MSSTELTAISDFKLAKPLYIVQYKDKLKQQWLTHMYTYQLNDAKQTAYDLMIQDVNRTRVVVNTETYHILQEYFPESNTSE